LNPGDIYWVEFARASGHEQSGRRPGVIVQDDSFGASLPLVIAKPLTTAELAGRFAGTVAIAPDGNNGLRRTSFALVFQIRAIDRTLVTERLGCIAQEQLAEMHRQLDLLLGRATASRLASGEEPVE